MNFIIAPFLVAIRLSYCTLQDNKTFKSLDRPMNSDLLSPIFTSLPKRDKLILSEIENLNPNSGQQSLDDHCECTKKPQQTLLSLEFD